MTNYICNYCLKTYVRKYFYEKHLLIHETPLETHLETPLETPLETHSPNIETHSPNIETPNPNIDFNSNINYNKILNLLIELNNKYNKLQKEINFIKKFVNIPNNNNIDILTYLNNNHIYDFTFHNFMDFIIIDNHLLNIIFQKDYIDGIFDIIIHFIEKLNSLDIPIPIKSFNNKENILYILQHNLNNNLKNWIIIDDIYFSKFINSIDKNIYKLFLIWKEEISNKLTKNAFSEIYIINMKKVIGANFENKNTKNIIKNKLFNYLKTDINSI